MNAQEMPLDKIIDLKPDRELEALSEFRRALTQNPRLRDVVFELAGWLAQEEEHARLRASNQGFEPGSRPPRPTIDVIRALLKAAPDDVLIKDLAGKLTLDTAVAPKPTFARGIPHPARPKRVHKARPQDPHSLDPIIEAIQIKLSVLDLRLEEATTPEADPVLRAQRLDCYRNLTHAHKRACWPLELAPPGDGESMERYEASRDAMLILARVLRLCKAARQIQGRTNKVLGQAVGLLMRCVRRIKPVLSRTSPAVRGADLDLVEIESWSTAIRQVRKLADAKWPVRSVMLTAEALAGLHAAAGQLESLLERDAFDAKARTRATTEARRHDRMLRVNSRETSYEELATHAIAMVHAADNYHKAGGSPDDGMWQGWVTRAVEVLGDAYPVPTGAEIILNEANWAHAQNAPSPQREMSPQIAAVRDLVEGRAAVIIGGVPKAQRIEAIREAFGLSRLEWPETRRHEDFNKYEPLMRRDDVTILFFVVKIADHFYADRLRAIARERGIVLVNIRAGYGPELIANDILEQASRVLADLPAAVRAI
ncbi:MAG: hypothetical protein NTV94_18735 [Planctomycetota bacterium]|nr:hypothetical protein [Planctomycetota bacterium]